MDSEIQPNMSTTTTYRREYRIKNNDYFRVPPRVYDIAATPEQIQHLCEEGYLVQECVIQGELLEQLRTAADEVAEAVSPGDRGGAGAFGGLFIRNLLDRHPTFLRELLTFAPTLSIARAVLGPQVQIHGSVLRVSYPEIGTQQVEWHFHQRAIPEPLPPFFCRPAVLDNLIYLDDLTMDTGPLVVMPRSHQWDEALPTGDFTDKPGQVVVSVPAGSIVTSHANLWHKAMPTLPGGTVRRLLILGYSPVWMKQIDPPGGGLTDTLLPYASEEIKELLGLSGYYYSPYAVWN